MNNLFASGLVAAAVALSASTGQTLPIWSDLTQDSMVVAVADGCGIGVDAADRCSARNPFHISTTRDFNSAVSLSYAASDASAPGGG